MSPKTTAAAIATAIALLAPATAGAYDQTTIPYTPGDPVANGCPSGWEALKLSDLAPYGYQIASQPDADCIVCGKPYTPQEQAAKFPDAQVPVVFDFRDNSLRAFQS
jgi:hypothetical protein